MARWAYSPLLSHDGIQQNTHSQDRRRFSNFEEGRHRLSMRWRTYYKFLGLFACALFFLMYTAFFSNHNSQRYLQLNFYARLVDNYNSNSNTCIFELPDPFDPSIREFLDLKPRDLKCKSVQPQFVSWEAPFIRILEERAKCKYRTFRHNTGVDDFYPKYDAWVVIEGERSKEIKAEFVEVSCEKTGFLVSEEYYNVFFQLIPRNISVETNKPFMQDKSRPSVLILGIDGASRSHFIREFPKTLAALERMGAVTFSMHSKLGDNSFPNLVALLMGKRGWFSAEFLPEVNNEYGFTYDNFTELIWRRFGRAGYATLHTEDYPEFATFTYSSLSLGFVKQLPADHYQRTYFIPMYNSSVHSRSQQLCFDSQPVYSLQLEYIRQFLQAYHSEGIPTFSFLWNIELAHSQLNTLQLADTDFMKFLIDNEKLLENTIILLLSDHGNRVSKIRQTVVGRVESRLPFLSIRFPKGMSERFPHVVPNMRKNANVFTTHFDTHEFFNDILINTYENCSHNPRAYSLAGEVPSNRSCRQLNVPDLYCPCYTEIPLDPSEAANAAEFFVRAVNEMIQGSTEKDNCVVLRLAKIRSAFIHLPPSSIMRDKIWDKELPKGLTAKYRISVLIEPPSNAILETIVSHNLDTNEFRLDNDIDRLDKYGNTTACARIHNLRKFCHCL